MDIRRRVLLFCAVLLLVVGVSPVAYAGSPSVGPVAVKACASAPTPAKPSNGLPGMLYPKPSSVSTGDPFRDPGVTIADVYGYSYRWQTYDNGCLPGADTVASGTTGIANSTLAMASSVNALTHQEFSLVIHPTWLDPLDAVIVQATQAVQRGFFTPWLTPILLLVAVAVLWAASRADMSTTVTTSGWAVLVLMVTTYVMSYPAASVGAVDALVQMTVTTAAQGTVEPSVPYAPDQLAPDPGSPFNPTSDISPAQRAMNSQMDMINRNTLYSGWLMGTFGSATSSTALTYGPALFKASHLSWAESEHVEAGNGAQIIAEKKKLWEETAARVQEVDPDAYQYLTGNRGRWEAMITTWVSVVATMPFLAVAGVLVIVAYGAIRLLVPLAPALGVFGMLMPLRGWMLGVLTRATRFIAMGPLFWAGSLANLLFLTAIFQSDIPYALKHVLAFMLPILLFSLLMPGKNNALGRIRRLVRSTSAQARIRAGSKKPEDKNQGKSKDEEPQETPQKRSPVSPPKSGDTSVNTVEREPSRRSRYPVDVPSSTPTDEARPGVDAGPLPSRHHEPVSSDEPHEPHKSPKISKSSKGSQGSRSAPRLVEAASEDLAEPLGVSPFGVAPESPVILDGTDDWVPWTPPEFRDDALLDTKPKIGV